MDVPKHLRRIHQEKYLNILQCTTRELRCQNASICLLGKRCDSLWKFDFMLLIICFMSYYTKAKCTINLCLLIYRHFILSIYKIFAQLLSTNFVMVSKIFRKKNEKNESKELTIDNISMNTRLLHYLKKQKRLFGALCKSQAQNSFRTQTI